MPSLSQNTLETIELAVHATGQQTVADMEARVTALRAAIQAQAIMLQQGAITTRQFTDAVDDLNRKLAEAEAQAAAAAQILGGTTVQSILKAQKAMEATTDSSKRFGYGILNISHALQDLQYGFGAVINNIPLVTQALGFGPGVAGVAMVAGVAISVFGDKLQALGRSLDVLADPLRDAASNVEGLKAKIAALEEKPLKVAADYESLKELRRELKDTEKAIQEWEALKEKRSETQEAAAKLITDAIAEQAGGGQTGGKNLEDAIIAAKKRAGTYAAGSELHGQIAYQRQNADYYNQAAKQAAADLNPVLAAILRRVAASYTAEAARLQDEMEKEARTKVAETIRHAPSLEGARLELEQLYDQNQDIFAQHSITPKFREALDKARPELRKTKEQKEWEQEEEKAQEHFDEVAQENADRGSKAFAKMEDDLTKATDATIEAAAKAADKEKKDAATARQKAIRENVQRFAPGVAVALERTMYGHIEAGMGVRGSGARLAPQLRQQLGQGGLARDLQPDVTAAILEQVTDRVNAQIEAAQLNEGLADREAAHNLGLQMDVGQAGRLQGREAQFGKQQQQVRVSLLANQAMNQYGAAPDVALDFARKSVTMAQERHLTLQQTTQIVMRQMQEDQVKFLQQAGLLQMDLNLMQARQRQIGQRRRGLNEGIP